MDGGLESVPAAVQIFVAAGVAEMVLIVEPVAVAAVAVVAAVVEVV